MNVEASFSQRYSPRVSAYVPAPSEVANLVMRRANSMRDARCFAMWCETPLALNYGQVQCSWCNWQGLELGPQSRPWANEDEDQKLGCCRSTPSLIAAQAHPRNLRALKYEQHVLIACARLTQRNERLILRRVVPGVEHIHVRKLDDDNALRLPMAALRQFVG